MRYEPYAVKPLPDFQLGLPFELIKYGPVRSKSHYASTGIIYFMLAVLFGWRHDQIPKEFWPSGDTLNILCKPPSLLQLLSTVMNLSGPVVAPARGKWQDRRDKHNSMISIVIPAPVDPTFQSPFVTNVFMSWYLGRCFGMPFIGMWVGYW